MPQRTSPYSLPVVFLGFALLAVALRWGSFFISVISHDESTYIVIADELLRGEVYLRDTVDTKPIGIFWVFAALIKLTGGSIPLLRLCTTLVIAGSSLGLFMANLRATGNRTAGYVAGVAYILMTGVYTDYGMAPNTEPYFNLLTVWAVAISVASPRKHWGWAGLLLGLAFIIKPFAAAEAGAVGLYLVWYLRNDIPRLLGRGLLLVAAWALPVAGVVAYFAYLDLLPELYFYGVTVAGAYPIELPWYLRLKYMADYLLRYAPLVVGMAGARVQGTFGKAQKSWLAYLLLQFVCVTVVVLLTGKRFGHYQIQLHPVMALAFGATAGLVYERVFRRRWVSVATVVAVIGIGIRHAVYYAGREDQDKLVAAYLAPRLRAGETFFPINGFQITYHLLDRPVPIPYVHSSLLFQKNHLRAFQIDRMAVARTLIDDPSVRYLVGRTDDPEAETPFKELLLEHFRPEGDIDENLRVWVRN